MKINNKFMNFMVLFSLSFLITSISQSYTLIDSEAYGDWKSEYANYNCYAFAINRTEIPPEFDTLKQYQPGDFSNQSISMSDSIFTIANVVKDDLEELSYSNINVSTNYFSGYDYTIVVRKGNDDYHFMKLGTDNNRYHKPGFTQVLRYKYQPSNSRIWTNEYIDENGVAHVGSIEYDSTIYYISYDNMHEHNYSYEYRPIDKKYHYSYCECGFKIKSGHVVTGSPNSHGEYNCLLCGGLAEIGFAIIDPISLNNEYVFDFTFVAPNGVLYLSVNDYKKFIDSTLKIPEEYSAFWEVI